MKNYVLKILFMAAAVVALSSCKGDDDVTSDETILGFTYEGQTYLMTDGFIEEYGENPIEANEPQTYNYDLSLYAGNLDVDVQNDMATGAGPVLYLSLDTESATGLVSGTYTFNDESFAVPDSIFDAGFSPDYDADNQTGGLVFADSGTVELLVSGSNYTVTVNLTLRNGNQITGTFIGDLQSFDKS